MRLILRHTMKHAHYETSNFEKAKFEPEKTPIWSSGTPNIEKRNFEFEKIPNWDSETLNFEKQKIESEKIAVWDLKRERVRAVSKLQEVNLAVSEALKEAIDVREQTLKARREALAARRESVNAQIEAMKVRNEVLQAKRDMAQAKRALAEVVKAISAIQHEVKQVRTLPSNEMEQQIVQQTDHENLNTCNQDKNHERTFSKRRRKSLLIEKLNEENLEKAEESVSNLDPDFIGDTKSNLVMEPNVIITNSHIVRANQTNLHEIRLKNNSFSDLSTSSTQESSHQQRSTESIKKAQSEVSIGDTAVSFHNVHTSDTKPTEKGVSGATHVVDITEIVEDSASSRRGSSDEDSDDSSSSDGDKKSSSRFRIFGRRGKKKGANNSTEGATTTGSFVQKWGDFIGRISTLMITIVTAVNTAEALIEALLAGAFAKAGTFAFLLICIHIPVAAVMTWLLLREKVQQIKEIVGKVKNLPMYVYQSRKLLGAAVAAVRSRRQKLLEGDELQEVTGEGGSETAEAESTNPTSSIFIVEPQRPQGVVNEAFTEDGQNGASPVST